MTVGVLALQGAFARHIEVLSSMGVETLEVRTPAHLERCAALVMPGGESTTMSKLLVLNELFDPLAVRLEEGMPAFGTCAGMILLAREVLGGRPDQRSFGAIDLTVRRNGYGRQIDSFEADLGDGPWQPVDTSPFRAPDTSPFRAVFIRAPIVVSVGPNVEVLAEVGGSPVLCRQGNVLVSSFHPELSDDDRIHRLFCERVSG